MNFDPSFFKEEIRSDFPVDEKRKKIWAVELQILEKIDEVCRKHNLTYYAYYGTLLGAVRHQGFVPWDDDLDIAMFRDDYEKFQAIAAEEFTEPYFFQNAYTDGIIRFMAKIRDSRTTAIEHLAPSINQGIFIDVFPLDVAPDGINEEAAIILEVQREIWTTVVNPREILEELEAGKSFVLDINTLVNLIKLDKRERFKEFEAFSLAHFGETQNVDFIVRQLFYDQPESPKKDWFKNIVYLPFENIQIPAPAEYDKILTVLYGNYHEFVRGGSTHEEIIMDPDISYKEYFSKYILKQPR